MLPSEILERLRGRVLAITGAGISAASGVPTFRGAGGLYEGTSPYTLASPEGFASDPVKVWNWYLGRLETVMKAHPNPAHHALVDLEGIASKFTLVTANVDDLHERAGSQHMYRLHGDLRERRCESCNRVDRWRDPPQRISAVHLPRCECGGYLRPNVVWFGEYPWEDAVRTAFLESTQADLVLEVGSSGSVDYGFVARAVRSSVPVVIINPNGVSEHAGLIPIAAKAEEYLPELVRAVA